MVAASWTQPHIRGAGAHVHRHGSAVEQHVDVVGTYYPERVITGELRSKVDRVWDAFWSGGISNPLEVIEQITYLLFMRRLDDLQTLAEGKARARRQPIENPVFLPGQNHLSWYIGRGSWRDRYVRRGTPDDVGV